MPDDLDSGFHLFMERAEPRLRRALIAAYGSERGWEATAEALAYAWEHWGRVEPMVNPIGYLYRVGQTRTRTRMHRPLFLRPDESEPWFEPSLAPALERLSERQRTAVVLVHGFGWTLREVAECTDVKVTSVQNHLDRGMQKLRTALKVGSDA